MPLCSGCGREILATDKFCTFCGTPQRLEKASEPVKQVLDQSVEHVVGVIPHLVQAQEKLTSKQWTLVATNKKIILVQFSAALMQEALALSKSKAKGFGKILAGKVLLAGDVVEFCRRYFTMSPENIVAETPGNVSIDLPDVRRAYIDFEQEAKDEDSHIQMDRYILELVTNKGEFRYVFDADPQDMRVLKSVLGEAVHGEGRIKALKPEF